MKYGQLKKQYRPAEHSIQTTLDSLKEAPESASSAQSRNQRILCVDDDMEGTRIRGEILVEQGYSVVLYHSPLAALRCELSLFDLAIVDFRMPELNGRELLLRMRALRARFPVVLLTGAADALSYEDRVLFARCIDKGRSIQHLLDTIAEFLDPNQIPDFGTRSLTPKQPAAFWKLGNHDCDERSGNRLTDGLRVKDQRKDTRHKECGRMYFEIAVIRPQQEIVVNQ
jgi:CheY-like chemotaxis protein